MEIFIAAFGMLLAYQCSSKVIAYIAFIVYQFFLLLVKINNLTIFNIINPFSPESAICMHINIQLVWNKATSYTIFSFLLTQYAGEIYLRILNQLIFESLNHWFNWITVWVCAEIFELIAHFDVFFLNFFHSK